MLAKNLDRLLAGEQGLERALDPPIVADEKAVDLAVMRGRRVEDRHLRHGKGAVADLLPAAAECGNLRHDRHPIQSDRSVPVLGDVRGEPSPLGQHHCCLSLKLDRRLLVLAAGARNGREAPRHQVPGHLLTGQVPRGHACGVDAVLGRKVAREPVDRRTHRLRHVVRERPVATNLHLRMRFLHLGDEVPQVISIRFAVELQELEPVRPRGGGCP